MYTAQVMEAVMLVCFGVSWPVAMFKTWRVKRTEGKSLLFLVLIVIGYLCGVAAKCIRAANAHTAPEAVTLLYAVNTLLVCGDIAMYLRYRPRAADVEPTEPTLP
jgi:hypothetical protein